MLEFISSHILRTPKIKIKNKNTYNFSQQSEVVESESKTKQLVYEVTS